MKSSNKKIICRVTISLILLLTVSCSSKKTLIVPVPDNNNSQGEVAIGQDDRTTVIDSPMTAAEVDAQGRVEKEVIPRSNKKTLIVLLPDDNNSQGKIAIGQGDRMTVIDSPMTAAEVDAQGRVQKEAISQAEVDKIFAEALAAQPPKQISFILYFEEGSTDVLEGSKNTLSELFEEVSKRQAVEVQVTGHTDTFGREVDNDRLSTERMQTIKEMFIKRGLQASFIRAVGRGERELLIQTPDNVREPRNRRVEVIVR